LAIIHKKTDKQDLKTNQQDIKYNAIVILSLV